MRIGAGYSFSERPLKNLWASVMVLCLGVLVSTSSAQTLDDAYRNELTRLKSEQASLRAALRNSKLSAEAERNQIVKNIELLAGTLTRLRADNTKKEIQLPQSERLLSMQEQERSIDRRERQIETWLETHGVSLPPRSSPDDADPGHRHPPLALMVEAALRHVQKHGQLWVRTNQEYFGVDGVAVVGPVLRIAEVGAVAVDDGFRPLELASDGSLRAVRQLFAYLKPHGDSRTVGVVLFDPDDTGLRGKSPWSALGSTEGGCDVGHCCSGSSITSCVFRAFHNVR